MNMTAFTRRPVALPNTTLYFQGRPNVVFLDRFETVAARDARRATRR